MLSTPNARCADRSRHPHTWKCQWKCSTAHLKLIYVSAAQEIPEEMSGSGRDSGGINGRLGLGGTGTHRRTRRVNSMCRNPAAPLPGGIWLSPAHSDVTSTYYSDCIWDICGTDANCWCLWSTFRPVGSAPLEQSPGLIKVLNPCQWNFPRQTNRRTEFTLRDACPPQRGQTASY